eukprot:jgi/Mesvir1/23951/Mv10721-RA.1
MTASYNEIYNERVTDLLVPPPSASLAVRHSPQRGFYVEGLTSVACPTLADALTVLNDGLTRRRVGAHLMNRSSSRSHSMMTLYLDCKEKPQLQADGVGEDDILNRPGRDVWRFGKIVFVDLAGSERLADTGNTTDKSIKEAGNINRSLFALGKVIAALSERGGHKGGTHVPFRDSKLTQLLIDSLQGSGRALMLACCSPQARHAEETINTLHFASLALHVRSKPVVILDPHDQLVIDLRKTIISLRNENKKLLGRLDELAMAETRRGPLSPGGGSGNDTGGNSSSSSETEDNLRSPAKGGAATGEGSAASRGGGSGSSGGSSSGGEDSSSHRGRSQDNNAGDAGDLISPTASDGREALSDASSSGRHSPLSHGGDGRTPKSLPRRASRLSSSTTAADMPPSSPSTDVQGGRVAPGSRAGRPFAKSSRGSSRSSESGQRQKKQSGKKGGKPGMNGGYKAGSGAAVAPSMSARDFQEFPELAALEQAFQANLMSARVAAPPPPPPPAALAPFPELAELEAEFHRRMSEARAGGAVQSREGDAQLRDGEGSGAPATTTPTGQPAYRYPFYTPMPSAGYPAAVASFLPSYVGSPPAPKPKPKAKKARPSSAKGGDKDKGGDKGKGAKSTGEKLPSIRSTAPPTKIPKPPVKLTPEQKAARWAEVNKWFGMDAEMTEFAYSVHDRIVTEENMDPTSDEYYAEIEKQVRAAFPDGWALYMEMADAQAPAEEDNKSDRDQAHGASGAEDRAVSAGSGDGGGDQGMDTSCDANETASPKPKKVVKKKPKEAAPAPVAQTREQSLDMEFRQLLKRPPAYRRSYSVLTHTLTPTSGGGSPLSPPLASSALPTGASPWPVQPRQTSAPHTLGDSPLSPPSVGHGLVHRSASSSGRLVGSSLTDLNGPRLTDTLSGPQLYTLRTLTSSSGKKPPFDSSPSGSASGARESRPSFDNSSVNFNSYSGGGMAQVATDADSFARRRDALVAELEQVKHEAERERQKIMRQIKKKLVKAQKRGMADGPALRSPSGKWER